MQLVRSEIEEKVSKVRKDAIALSIGGAVAYAGLLAISAGVILVLANWIPAWIAALIVGAVLVVGGAALLFAGKVGLQHLDPVPRKAVQSVRTDFRTIQQAAR
jgi:CHASE2 domain-containing sensor protein